MDIQSRLHSNFVQCESFLKSNSHSGHFFVRGYLPLIRKHSITYIHGLAVYVTEGILFPWDVSLENSSDSDLCFWLAILYSVPYFFFLYWSPSLLLCMVFDYVPSNIDVVLSINPFAIVFVFGNLNVHYKNWLTCSGGTDRPGELCYNFSISNYHIQMVNFHAWIPNCDSHSPALLDLFLSSDARIPSTITSVPLRNPDHHWLSNKLKTGFPISSHSLWLFLCWLGWSLWSFERYSVGGYL